MRNTFMPSAELNMERAKSEAKRELQYEKGGYIQFRPCVGVPGELLNISLQLKRSVGDRPRRAKLNRTALFSLIGRVEKDCQSSLGGSSQSASVRGGIALKKYSSGGSLPPPALTAGVVNPILPISHSSHALCRVYAAIGLRK